MKVEAADPKVSGELLFPPADGIIGIVIRFESRLPRSMTLLARTKGRWKKKNEAEKDSAEWRMRNRRRVRRRDLVRPGDLQSTVLIVERIYD